MSFKSSGLSMHLEWKSSSRRELLLQHISSQGIGALLVGVNAILAKEWFLRRPWSFPKRSWRRTGKPALANVLCYLQFQFLNSTSAPFLKYLSRLAGKIDEYVTLAQKGIRLWRNFRRWMVWFVTLLVLSKGDPALSVMLLVPTWTITFGKNRLGSSEL